jgi:MerR-like DNA binding protein
MTTTKGALRNITGASIETETPVTTLREWDPAIKPILVGKQRVYDDTHIAKINQIKALKSKHGV